MSSDSEVPVQGADTPLKHLTGKSKKTASDGYWGSDDDVKEAINERRKQAARKQDPWRAQAEEAYEFVAGKQWSKDDLSVAENAKKPLVTFNRVGPIVNAVCGQQICNRQETRYLPRESGDLRGAEIWGKVVIWAREQCDAEDEESDAFRDLVITGMGWTCTTVSYDDDPEGMILEQRIDPRRFRWDPSARKKNITDARWVQCDWMYSKTEIEEKWPGKELEISAEPRWTADSVNMPHDATNAWRYTNNSSAMDEVEGKYRCIHEIHWRLEDVYQVLDGEKIAKFTKSEWDELVKRLKKLGMPQPKFAKTKGRVYYEAWTCGDTVLGRNPYPLKTGFEYKPMTGLRDESGQWYGLVLALMDPQRFANKTFTQIVQILNSNAKGGILAETGAVENHKKFEDEWSKSDGVAWVADGAVANDRVKPKPPPQIPAELTKLLEYSVGGMREVTGVNVEFLGQTDKVQPGVVEAMRTKAGLVILAPWFDAMRLYMKQQGRLLGEFIYTYIADGRWVRISGIDDELQAEQQAQQPPQQPPQPPQGMGMPQGMPPQGMGAPPPMGAPPQGMPPAPTQSIGGMPSTPPMDGMRYIQLIKREEVLKYDIVVDESTMSRDSRERNFQALLSVVPMAMQSGVPVPPEVLDYAPLPETLRIKWKALIKKQMSKPPEPPLPLLIEKMRGQNAKDLQSMKDESKKQSDAMTASLKDHHEQMKAQVEAQKQEAQAWSEQMVEQNRTNLDAHTEAMRDARERERMAMESKFNTFEIMLKAVIDMHKASAANAASVESAKASQPKDTGLGDVMPQIAELMTQGQQQMSELMRVLSAPVEMTKDAKTGAKRVRRVLN